MNRVYTVTLPATFQPVFPPRCVRCLASPPSGKVRIVRRNNLRGIAFWSGWRAVTVPACRPCGRRLVLWHLWDPVRTLGIAGAAFAFGVIVLVRFLPGWGTGLSVLGLCVLGFALAFIWNRLHPPPFTLDPGGREVDYEFSRREVAEEFARLNGATPGDAGP